MTREIQEKLDRFFAAFAGAIRPLLLLDYDGTLAPFRVDRFEAVPWSGVREWLNRIQIQTQTRMVIVTGRPAGEIGPLLGLDSTPEVWGLHGVERLHTDGRREMEQLAPQLRDKLDKLRTHLRRDSLGALLEEKHNAVALHWRGVSNTKANEIQHRARALFEPFAQTDGLILLVFEAGLELRAGRDKGGAVRAILDEEKEHGPQPVAFLGDDMTDEAAFLALNDRELKDRGLGILVRSKHRETAADIWLKPPAELRAFLKRWFEACESS